MLEKLNKTNELYTIKIVNMVIDAIAIIIFFVPILSNDEMGFRVGYALFDTTRADFWGYEGLYGMGIFMIVCCGILFFLTIGTINIVSVLEIVLYTLCGIGTLIILGIIYKEIGRAQNSVSGLWIILVVYFFAALTMIVSSIYYIFYITKSLIVQDKRTGKIEDKYKVNSCSKCGLVIVKGAAFCHGCGTKVEEIKSESDMVFCINCGEKLYPGAQFCSSCGYNVGVR